MKVLSVSNYYQKNYPSVKSKNSNSGSNATFKGWNVKALDLSEEALKTVAKSFYKSTQEELIDVTTETVLGIKQKNKSLAAYFRLKAATDNAKLDADSLQSMIQTIERKTTKNQVDLNSLAMLNSQLKEYEDAFASRKEKYYTSEGCGSNFDDDWDYQIQLSKSDGSWYDY